jgi:hypothetical protein
MTYLHLDRLIIVMEWFKGILLRLLEPIIGMSMESFFLPSKETLRGGYRAIPNQFKIQREGCPDTFLQNIDYKYEEEVYDLEPLRYPFKIQLMEELPKRMIEHFRKAIAGKRCSSHLHAILKGWKLLTSTQVFDSRRATARVARHTWLFLLTAFEIIHPNDCCTTSSGGYSTDERVYSNIHIKLPSSSETAILGEALDARNAETYISDLVKLASGELPSSFEGELPDKFVGHEAILAKVWHLL